MTTYTTTGSVRGTCGHKHRNLSTAFRCLRADQRGCAKHGGYSDRRITRSDEAPLTDDEREDLFDLQDGAR